MPSNFDSKIKQPKSDSIFKQKNIFIKDRLSYLHRKLKSSLNYIYFIATKHNLSVSVKDYKKKSKFIFSGGRACKDRKILRFVRQRRDACDQIARKVKFWLTRLRSKFIVFYFYGVKRLRKRFVSGSLRNNHKSTVLFFGDITRVPHNGCGGVKKKNRKGFHRKKKFIRRGKLLLKKDVR